MSYNKQNFLSDWEKALKKLQCRILKTFWKISGNSLPKSAKLQWDMWVWQPLLAISALLTLHCSCSNIMEERTREMVHNENGILYHYKGSGTDKESIEKVRAWTLEVPHDTDSKQTLQQTEPEKGDRCTWTRMKWLFNALKTLFIYLFLNIHTTEVLLVFKDKNIKEVKDYLWKF